MRECKHPTCGETCRRPKKVKKKYYLKRTPIKRKRVVNRKPRKEDAIKELLQLAQMVFNKWVRERDKEKPCISSGGFSEQAGHYYAAGSFSGVRFDEMNVNGQTKEDNCFKGGNEKSYREGLIDRYGLAAVLELDKRAQATKFYKWSREELEDIIRKYKI